MKNARKLIPAVAMLLVAVIMLSTSSYAWFSMNKTVTATGMAVTAIADNSFLEIKLTNGGAYDTTADGTIATNTQLKPTSPKEALSSTNIQTLATWGTYTSDDPSDANAVADVSSLTALPAGTAATNGIDGYVAKQSFTIHTLEGTNDATNLKLVGLKVADDEPTDALDCFRIVLVCGTTVMTIEGDATTLTDTVLAATVNTTGVVVDAYFYYDGQDTDCKTDNATNIGTITVDFEFAVNGQLHDEAKLATPTASITE